MNNHRLTICFALLGIILISMVMLVFRAHAQGATPPVNPYDDANLGIDEVISLYHNNMNDEFNRYIKLLMTNLDKNPDDQEGKAFGTDKKPLTATQCMNDPNNYSTFCVAVNLLGASGNNCNPPVKNDGTPFVTLKDDMKDFCALGADAVPVKGYLNFAAALRKRTNKIFQTSQEQNAWNDYITATTCAGISSDLCDQAKQNKDAQTVYQTQKALEISSNLTKVQNEIVTAKNTLDQTLSAYDQLRTAWPMHKKYVEVYSLLEQYRDLLVDVRHQTDLFPNKFIDLTTTACK